MQKSDTLTYMKHTLLTFYIPLFQDQVFTTKAVMLYIDEAFMCFLHATGHAVAVKKIAQVEEDGLLVRTHKGCR